MARRSVCWLVDSESFKPPSEYRISKKIVDDMWRANLLNTPFIKAATTPEEREAAEKHALDVLEFQYRVFDRSGLSGELTHLPPSLNPKFCGFKPRTDIPAAYEEAREAVFGAVEGLLAKTGLTPGDIDILITTCSIFCPTPSLASLVVNRFKMRPDVQSYHLGGMGCSNGVVAVNMVRDLLAARPRSNLLFITHETTTPAFYAGSDKSRLVTNVLFRMGASAVLFSNNTSVWRGRAKYALQRATRVHAGAREAAYRCIWYGPDEEGHNGVALGMELVTEASRALTTAMKRTARHIMTWRQVAEYCSWAVKDTWARTTGAAPPLPYQPAFNQGVQHFLLHAGGAKVLDGLGKSLGLNAADLEPSRAVLHDYGNVSSSTTWYCLGFVESLRGVAAGDRLLQVGVGSGIKCGVNVWKALRDVHDLHGAWEERITPERRAAVLLRRSRLGAWHVALRAALLVVLLLLAWLAWAKWADGTPLLVSWPRPSLSSPTPASQLADEL